MSDCEEHDFHQSAQDCPWCMREELIRLRAEVDFLKGALRKAHRSLEQSYSADAQRIVKHALGVIDE